MTNKTQNLTPFTTVNDKTLFVAYHATDCGPYSAGNTFDEFALMQDGKKIAVLRVEYGDDATPITTKLSQVDSHPAAELPYITSAMHLSAAIIDTVMHAYTEDNEFYYEVFQDEDGQMNLQLPLLFAH
jgi:hypothetical protein